MRVVLDARAVGDLGEILDWIAQDSPRTADRVVGRILDSVERLGRFPEMGRNGRDPGTREWVVPGLPYIAVYELRPEMDELVVIAVFHGAKDR
ncbi:MAG: type II toxin-antitoxin system RelE/ParE family toxin [Rhizobiales bacterium]|nr:type II toxin-antitoxin system RelE/ParE family toxin [Hyphomicrobiales bacterium]